MYRNLVVYMVFSTIITRLYPSRNVSFIKTYIFENDEKSQKDEPLSVEYDIPNTSENNLGIPLPKGEIQLYQLLENGTIEFIGKDEIGKSREMKRLIFLLVRHSMCLELARFLITTANKKAKKHQ